MPLRFRIRRDRRLTKPTGASGSGSAEARRQQESIIKLLLERGAKVTEKDSLGKTVEQAATSKWIRMLLSEVG